MKKILKPLTIGTILASTAIGTVAQKTNSIKEKPNFLFLFADDQTYNTINALYKNGVRTPNLDKLSKKGVVFTHCFNQGAWGGAVCVASRTMILTGQYVFNAPKNDKVTWVSKQVKNFIKSDERTDVQLWPETFKKAGYDTYLTGKWHNSDYAALKSFTYADAIGLGMYEQFDKNGSKKSGYNRPTPENNTWRPWDKSLKGHWSPRVKDIIRDENGNTKIGPRYVVTQHTSELYADNAINFLLTRAKTSDNPFMMYVAFNAPHDPRQSPKKYVDMYPTSEIKIPENYLPEHPFDQGDHKLRDEVLAPFPRTKDVVKTHIQEYNAIITHMDNEIGRILNALEKSGKADNTYIIFSADHGLAVGQHGLMGKQNQYDHSVRMPLIISGPGIAKGKQTDAMVYLQSMFATTCDLAGLTTPSTVDFPSLKGILDGKQKKVHDAVYGCYKNLQRMVRTEKYKLIHYPHINKTQLFDLEKDPLEMNDISENRKMRKVKKKMIKKLKELQKLHNDPLILKI